MNRSTIGFLFALLLGLAPACHGRLYTYASNGAGGSNSTTSDPADSAVVAACKQACDTFVGGKCYGACVASCRGSCALGRSASDFDNIGGLDCSDDTVNFLSGSDSVSCVVAPGPRDDGSGNQKRMFVTSSAFTANLAKQGGKTTGLAGADHLCNNAAQAAQLGGAWRAWLSDSAHDAIDRINDVGPWLNVTKTVVLFPNWAALTQSPDEVLWSYLTDEYGQMISLAYVWTGTGAGGHVASYSTDSVTCADWTDDVGTYGEGWVGTVGYGAANWTDAQAEPCYQSYSLYCIEQ
jgi:hypothetical protein